VRLTGGSRIMRLSNEELLSHIGSKLMRMMPSVFAVVSFVVVSSVIAAEPTGEPDHWPRFRGPLGTGQSEATNLPKQLSADSIAWASELPIRGHSSPIIWGNRIFLTGTAGKAESLERRIVCINRENGDVLWNEVAATGRGEKLHKMNSWATPSCATDGERVVAFFGAGGLHCFSVDGKPLWSRDLGEFPGAWGVGASPIFHDELVIQNCDAEGDSFLLAVDKRSGKDVWRTPRQSKPKGGWSTPIVIDASGRTELVLNGEFGVASYDPNTGKKLWNCQGFNGRGTPAPVWGNGMLYVVNGKSGDVYTVKPGGQGDVTESRMVWHTPRSGGRDLPSPTLAGNVMVVIGMSGIATGYNALSGDELWKERLGGNFSGSPVVAEGLIYAASEKGEVMVIKAEPSPGVISRTAVRVDDEEIFRSSIAINQGQLLLRSDRRLYCIGK
jgi:outer membrane protein assembly factor BamB